MRRGSRAGPRSRTSTADSSADVSCLLPSGVYLVCGLVRYGPRGLAGAVDLAVSWSPDLQDPDYRVGLVVVDDDSLVAWDLVDRREGDGLRAAEHVHVRDLVAVGFDAVGQGGLCASRFHGVERK